MSLPAPLQEIVEIARKKRSKIDEVNLLRAYEFAKQAHEGQLRKSGEPFFTHPLAVAKIIADMGLDDNSIIAAFLHDVVEDTSIPMEEIQHMFGGDVASLVAGETNLGHLKFISEKSEYQAENLRKMFLAMSKDMRVVLIKLSDRLHNMRTMKYQTPERRVRKSKETLEIYAPLASRLGMGQIRGELEDLAFQWVHPRDYEELKEQIRVQFKESDRLLAILKRQIKDKLNEENIQATIEARAKHLYSLWKKLQRPEINGDISKVPDLIALRVILEQESVENCYITLGLVHQIWTPLAGRVSDYIATPKANGYRSLHTKVFVDKGRILEVQIRTSQMHEQAEFGIASHIIYEQLKMRKGIKGEEVDRGVKASRQQLDWIKELTKWQKEAPDSEGFLQGLRLDIFKDRIFVYTPKGDVKDLPTGATPIDFAYSIHSEIGDRTVGARIDGHIVPLNYQLRSGEIVEILTAKENKQPSADWLRFVVTNTARKQIQKITSSHTIYEADKIEQVDEKDLDKRPDSLEPTPSQLLIKPLSLMEKVRSSIKNRLYKKPISQRAAVVVHGLKGVATRMARCCNPLPGEDIIGFVTQDQVVSIHSAICQNVATIVHKEKQIPVNWSLPAGMQKALRMKLEMGYREGALRDVTKVLSDSRVAIEQFEQLPAKDGILKIQFVVGIDNEAQKQSLYSKLQRVRGVHSLE